MEVYTDKTINKLFSQNKHQLVLTFYKHQIAKGIKINQGLFNRLLIVLEKNKDYENLLTSYLMAMANKSIIVHEQTSTIVIRTYLCLKKVDKAYEILYLLDDANIKKRTLILFFDYYYLQQDLNAMYYFYFSKLRGEVIMNSDDYNKLLTLIFMNDNKKICSDILNDILGKKIIFDYPTHNKVGQSGCTLDTHSICSNCNNPLTLVSLTDHESKILLTNLEKTYLDTEVSRTIFSKFTKFIDKNQKIKIVIDGANILFFGDRKINFYSYLKLDLIIKKLLKIYFKEQILLVIHQRHNDHIKQNFSTGNYVKIKSMIDNWNTNILVYFTPYNMNDDWFIVYAGIKYQESLILSNDLLKDHKFKISEEIDFEDIFNKWIEVSRIGFDFREKKYDLRNLELIFPNTVSHRVQENGKYFHIPSLNDTWVCIPTI
jgi:hypothetical protein